MFPYLYDYNKVAAYKSVSRKKTIFCIELDETLQIFFLLKKIDSESQTKPKRLAKKEKRNRFHI